MRREFVGKDLRFGVVQTLLIATYTKTISTHHILSEKNVSKTYFRGCIQQNQIIDTDADAASCQC